MPHIRHADPNHLPAASALPCYVVPRGSGLYMIGATMVANDDSGPITARAVMELLSAAYCGHPGFAEARLAETGAGLRPAFPDNIPLISASVIGQHGYFGFARPEAFADRANGDFRFDQLAHQPFSL